VLQKSEELSELVTLGADVLPSVSSESDLMDRDLLKALGADAGQKPSSRPSPVSGPVPRRKYYGLRSSFVLTRLHARYTRDAIGDDLVFKEAPPLVGGREFRRADGALETSAVVASDVGGIPEMVEDGVTGLLVQHDNPIALADAIVRLLTDHAFADTIARAGHDLVHDRFCIELMVKSIEQVYDEGARAIRLAEAAAS